MFSRMRTGTKILAGFGFAIVISMAVGVVGYVGIHKLGVHVDDIGNNKMPSVKYLQEIKGGGEQIKTAQRTLFNFNTDPATRERQVENIAKARESYEAAWKAYEALPQTAEEGELWKKFVDAWGEWRTDNNEFFRLSKELEELIQKCPGNKNPNFSLPNELGECQKQLAATIESFKNQVQEWKDILLRGNDPADYDKYYSAFQKDEEIVQSGLAKLKTMVSDVGLDAQLVSDIERSHSELNAKYKDALKSFDKSKQEAGKTVDKLVRGLDRPVSEKMDSLAAIITRDANKLGELERKMAVQSTTVCRLSQLKANDILDQIIKVNADDANESVKKAQSDASFFFLDHADGHCRRLRYAAGGGSPRRQEHREGSIHLDSRSRTIGQGGRARQSANTWEHRSDQP